MGGALPFFSLSFLFSFLTFAVGIISIYWFRFLLLYVCLCVCVYERVRE